MQEEYIPNNKKKYEYSVSQDFGSILRELRENIGISIQKLSKRTGITPARISSVERCLSEIPNDAELRGWLQKLGCGGNTSALMKLAQRHRVFHRVSLHAKDPSNADLTRLLELYKDKKLTQFDRDLLSLIGDNHAG
jgi:predicted transcriptional regulator